MLRKYILIASATLFAFTSCLDLDVENPSTINDEDVWNDPTLIQMYVNHLYIKLPGWDHKTYNNISDEARDNYPGNTAEGILRGEWNEASNPMDNWEYSYQYIRVANDFLKNSESMRPICLLFGVGFDV